MIWNTTVKIALWELKRKIQSKSFILSLIIFPVLLIGTTLIPFTNHGSTANTTEAIAVLDNSGEYAKELFTYSNSLIESGTPDFLFINAKKNASGNENVFTSAIEMLRSSKIDAILVIDKQDETEIFKYYASNLTRTERITKLKLILKKIKLQNEISASRNNFVIPDTFFEDAKFQSIHVNESQFLSEDVFQQQFLTTLFPVAVFFIIISFSGGLLIRSMFEEKSNNLLDVLLSSCSIKDVMTGKLLGLAAVNIIQLLVWILLTGVALSYTATTLYPVSKIIEILLYVVFGLIMYNAMYVGLGVLITDEQTAQYITSYFSLLVMIPGIFIFSPMYSGGMDFLKICTYIPIFTPTAALIRLQLGSISIFEMFGIIIFMLAVSISSIVLCAKLFRYKHRYFTI